MSLEQPHPRLDPLATVAELQRAKDLGENNSLEIGQIHQQLEKIWIELHATRIENRRSRVFETLVILAFAGLIAYAVATTATNNTIRVLVEQGLVQPRGWQQK